MPVIDGEKWACSSCIKGHRVSGCNHNDRELHHINPKGRPVKQCEHCRGARKSKSHHAKCDCGDKKDKDKQKEKGDAKAFDGRCQCHSGAKCICGNPKEHGDVKLDSNRLSLHDARAKPKLMTTHSEPQLTIFANGHHKPCHRNNNTAHVSGVPYKIPRPHTLHGHSAFAALAHGNSCYSKPDVPATRSMDTLSLSNNDFYAMFGSTQRSVDSLPIANMASNLDPLPYQDVLFGGSNSMFRQDGNSPINNGDTFSGQQWPWTSTTVAPIPGTFAYANHSTSPSQERLPNLENDWALPSAGFNPLWSAGDLPLNPSKFSDSLAQPTSHSGESKQSGPGLTAASSAHSEVGESNPFMEMDFKTPQSAASESLFWEDSPVYRLNTSAPNESIAAPVSMPAVTSMPNIQLLEPTYAKNLTAMPNVMTNRVSAECAEPAAIAMPSNFEDISIDSWPLGQSNFGGMNGFELSYANNNNSNNNAWF